MKKQIVSVLLLSLASVITNAQPFNSKENDSPSKDIKQQKALFMLKKGFEKAFKTKQITESKIDSIILEMELNGTWQMVGVINFSYSEESPQETILAKLYYDGNWIPTYKDELYKSSEGRIDSILMYEYDGAEYMLTDSEKYFYDNEQRIDSMHIYGDYDINEVYDEYISFTHSTPDSILYKDTYTEVESGEAQTETGEGYFINKNGNLYEFYENDLGFKYRNTFFNFSFDELVQTLGSRTMYVSSEYAVWNNEDYVPSQRSTFVFNEDFTKLISGKEQFYNGIWIDIRDFNFTYNNDLLSVIETTDYQDGDVYVMRELISYKNTTSNDSELIMDGYKLSQNYPNPFNPNTIIKYSIPVSSNVSIEIYNMLGQKMSTILNEFKIEGSHQIEFDASSFPSGVYMYRLQADAFVETKLMTLIK